MLLSKSCVYGLKASLFLASAQDEGYISIREVSEQLEISFHFLTKVLQELTAAGLLESQKGPKGGVRLTRSGSEMSLYEIVEAIDGTELFTECALGLPGCGTAKPCPLHEKWGQTRDRIRGMLVNTNLAELALKSKNMDWRITDSGEFKFSNKNLDK